MQINTVAEQVLRDAEVYLANISPDVYATPLDLLFGASIGQHTRHFVEFYQCLIDQNEKGEINYSKRLRDPQLEEDPRFAIRAIVRICTQLNDLDSKAVVELHCDEHFKGEATTVSSNVGRELVYNIEHTIHHLAIIKIGLAAVAPNINIPEQFGVAPSTIQHRRLCAQ